MLFLPVAIFCLVWGEEIPLSVGVLAAFIGLVSGGKYGKRGWKGMQSVQEAKPDNSSAAELEKLRERVTELEQQAARDKEQDRPRE